MAEFSIFHWLVGGGMLFIGLLPFLAIGLVIWLIVVLVRKSSASKSAASGSAPSVEARIAELDRLHKASLISDQEYSAKKSEILKSL